MLSNLKFRKPPKSASSLHRNPEEHSIFKITILKKFTYIEKNNSADENLPPKTVVKQEKVL